MVTAPGAYHPIVASGLYYADGLAVSDYYSGMPLSAWRFGRAYAVLRYKIGVPVVGEGQGPISSLAVVKIMPSAPPPLTLGRTHAPRLSASHTCIPTH
jgi:hypothetical protein